MYLLRVHRSGHKEAHARTKRGAGGSDPPTENQTAIGLLNNTGPDPLDNHKATNPAFNDGPSSAGQRNAI